MNAADTAMIYPTVENLIKAYEEYKEEEIAFELAHPFDFMTYLNSPKFRDMNDVERAGELLADGRDPGAVILQLVLHNAALERHNSSLHQTVLFLS